MYKQLLILLFIITSSNIYGQDYYIGVFTGYKNSNIRSDIFENSNSRKSIEMGLSLERNHNKTLHSEIGLHYSQKGFVTDEQLTDLTGQPLGELAKTHFNYNYLSIPIKVGYNYGNRISGFINIGVSPSLLLNSKLKIEAIEDIMEEVSVSTTESVSKFDIGGMVELGGKYQLSKSWYIFTSVELESSFISITNEDYFKEESIKHYGINLRLGLKYALLNKTGSNKR